MTREAGLAFIADLQAANAGNGFTDRPDLPSYSKISELDEVTYRWEISWLESSIDTSSKSIHELSDIGTLSTIDLASTDANFLTDDYLATQLIQSLVSLNYADLKSDSTTIQKISESFDEDGVVDTTYSNLRDAGGRLFSLNTNLDTVDKVTEALNQDLIIRAFSIVASIDERDIASEN